MSRAQALVAGALRANAAHVRDPGLADRGPAAPGARGAARASRSLPARRLAAFAALGAFGLYGFSGRADHDAARLALCRKLAPHYGEDWWFLTHLGWSHTEAGKLAAGDRHTQRALELRRENAQAAHALAHFFAEADEGEDGSDFVEDWLPGYDPSAMLYAHIRWHSALWRLDAGDIDGALELYDEVLRPALNQAPPIMVDLGCRIASMADLA